MRGKKLLDAIRGGSGGGVEVVCAELKREGDKIDFAAAEFRAAKRKATPEPCARSCRPSPTTSPSWLPPAVN
ncbi:hypothetical protein GCM10025869_35440 [Homoserinibacter gongjuensis]|uniref:Uncharacterized protein n=1 Tax=Homoserinibacter gongjuensis TaxID=1162968 RepID=A0ABQ6JXI0_9MICO|nr:hypothetical protein GCM10025869_35440 [Homoserinibacter gongjuensis]